MNIHDDELTYAIDAAGNLVPISSISPERRGKKCGCTCPKCKAGLYAKLGSGELNGRRPHFAHEAGSDCHGAGMTVLHMLAEQIIEEEKAVMAPSYNIIPPKKLQFIEVEIEKRVDRSDLQPDIVGIAGDGLRWHVEIKNTNKIKEKKKAKLFDSHITCLEIDISEQIQDKDKLKDFLLNSVENREWINNPIYDQEIEEIKKKERAEVERKLASYDKSKYDIQDESYCRNKCEYNEYGLCEFKVNQFSFYGSTIVVCYKEKEAQDKARIRKRSISTINEKKRTQPYSEICAKGLSLHEIYHN